MSPSTNWKVQVPIAARYEIEAQLKEMINQGIISP